MTAAVAAAVAVLLLIRPDGSVLRSGALRVSAGLAGTGIVVGLVLHQKPPLVLLFLVPACGAALLRQVRRRRAAAASALRASEVLATCEALAADLAAGLSTHRALAKAARRWPEFAPAAHAAQLGADVPGALRELADLPGAAALNHVAAAWAVAHRSGAGLAGAMALAARALREDQVLVRTVATELAAALATARLLAVLPLPVLLIGRGAGGDPFAFLLGTSPGLACLGIGLVLAWLGTEWLNRIAETVRPP